MSRNLIMKGWMMVGVAVLVLAGAAPARADEQVVAKVPFDFIVAGMQMPAGTYVVTLSNSSIASVSSTDRRHFTFVLTNPVAPEDAGTKAELVFRVANGNHFLERIADGDSRGCEIPLKPALLERSAERVAVALTPARVKIGD